MDFSSFLLFVASKTEVFAQLESAQKYPRNNADKFLTQTKPIRYRCVSIPPSDLSYAGSMLKLFFLMQISKELL